MRLENQVCSLELAKKLKSLGVKQDSYWYWSTVHSTPELKDKYTHPVKQALTVNSHWLDYIYSAFTVAELGEMLPIFIGTYKGALEGWNSFHIQERISQKITKGEVVLPENEAFHTEASARAKMLIYLLLENKLIKLK